MRVMEEQEIHAQEARDVERRISRSKIRMRARSPFLGTLTYFAPFRVTESVMTAATDGETVYMNPSFAAALSNAEMDGILLHEVLHAALLHVGRCGDREAVRWNVAADVVVNGLIAKQEGYELPEGAVREERLEDYRVEEVYALLDDPGYEHLNSLAEAWRDLKERVAEAAHARMEELENHWRQALRQAQMNQQLSQRHGSLPNGFERHVDQILHPQVNWRQLLWGYLVTTPTDYSGFDRRFVYRGQYVDDLQVETLTIHVAIDTSGSIASDTIGQFLGEVQAILRAYPHVEVTLYYADADLYGPYDVRPGTDVPEPKGGGGTSFVPFFEKIQRDDTTRQGRSACVYLTDGYGAFPDADLHRDTIWVVTPGGLDSEAFPFGRVIRLVDY